MKVEIITPEKIAFQDEADQISLPTADGEITVLPGHIPLVTQILPGEIALKKGDRYTSLASGGGFAQISAKAVYVATDLAQRPEEIDEKAAEEARKRAEEALSERHRLSEEEYALVAGSLQRALAQLNLKRKHRK